MTGALPAICPACGGRLSAEADWRYRCGACRHLCSTLDAGPGTGIAGLEALRRQNFSRLLDRLASTHALEGKRLLEVGAAKGWFLEAARSRGLVVRGIEPEVANAHAARAAGFDVDIGLFPEALSDDGPYAVIVFNDVFEHLPDPAAGIRSVADLLAPGGVAVLNLPSSDGAIYQLARILAGLGMPGPLDRLWQVGFPSPHISYFNPKSLSLLVEGHTDLRQADAFALATVTRAGLWERVASSHRGPIGGVLFAGTWLLSWALPLLPADIHVGVFRKPS